MMIKSPLLIMAISAPFVLSLFNLNKIYKINLIKKLLQYTVSSKKIKSKSKLINVETISKIHTKNLEITQRHTKLEIQMAVGLPIDNMYFDE
jgi:hypothetical protein